MASFDTNAKFMAFVEEDTPGTRKELTLPDDNNIDLFDVGEASYDIPKEPIGELADGTFKEGPAYSRERKISIPDHKTEIVWSGDVEVEPKWFKLAKAGGYAVVLNGLNPELVWQGYANCTALSGDLINYGCGSTPTGIKDKFRGAVGNFAIGSDGTQAPIIGSMTGMMGAYLGTEDVSAAARIGYGTKDTAKVEQMGKYTLTFGGVVYAVHSWEFNPNNEINSEGGNNDEGVVRMKITNQGARLTMTVTKLSKATDDPIADMFENNVIATWSMVGGTGAHFDFTATDCDYIEVQQSDADGTSSYDITLKPDTFKAVQKA